MTMKEAITKVLTGRRKPMRVPDIIKAVLPLRDPEAKGKTPGQQVYSILYTESKKADGARQDAYRAPGASGSRRAASLRVPGRLD